MPRPGTRGALPAAGLRPARPPRRLLAAPPGRPGPARGPGAPPPAPARVPAAAPRPAPAHPPPAAGAAARGEQAGGPRSPVGPPPARPCVRPPRLPRPAPPPPPPPPPPRAARSRGAGLRRTGDRGGGAAQARAGVTSSGGALAHRLGPSPGARAHSPARLSARASRRRAGGGARPAPRPAPPLLGSHRDAATSPCPGSRSCGASRGVLHPMGAQSPEAPGAPGRPAGPDGKPRMLCVPAGVGVLGPSRPHASSEFARPLPGPTAAARAACVSASGRPLEVPGRGQRPQSSNR
ncbi:basic proline-rich protein-like [Choloepus didactylus]|uniref:basic proline-rich protein-like n=1 Tax=Choloepus didactylus TaxID=27675 RepID=UPI0018A026E0|nr:basic proline-rich protein-like [Choloepus didactylus]